MGMINPDDGVEKITRIAGTLLYILIILLNCSLKEKIHNFPQMLDFIAQVYF